ncbi:MAG: RsmE family RNA methyltransferase [Akkermansiaceae bacterium]|nr:RsmE family RNA methyltransferase [Akkermansiaceae bacterium]
MHRFLLPPEQWSDAVLTGDEAKHLAQVLRIKSGAEITVFDGEGRRAPAVVGEASRKEVHLRIGESIHIPPPFPSITLLQAIPKGKNMELIVQKAVELGVAHIQPLITRNTVVQPGEGKADKWRRIALEACKQCGQDNLPDISDPLEFDAWLESSRDHGDLAVIASLAEGALPLPQVLQSNPKATSCSLLIGPEGDFTPQETAAAIDTGFRPATLGGIVLRVETATLYGLSALRYEFSR